jgi:hypothetical protein
MSDVAVFTPDDEPYLGRQAVYHFDRVLKLFIDEQTRIGGQTRQVELSSLQEAAAELVPAASSVALSIRELVRQGFLLSAMILARPLFERTATLSYLIENPDAVQLWQNGWPHDSRPSIRQRMTAMGDVHEDPVAGGPPISSDELTQFLSRMNSLIHGNPDAALHGAVLMADGRPRFTISKDLDSPARADEICWNTTMMLVVLLARSTQLFPQRNL